MKYLLLIHHNESMFTHIPEGTRKDMLAESIQLCHQPDDVDHSETIQERAIAISQWEANSNVSARRVHFFLIERVLKFRVTAHSVETDSTKE